MNCNSCGWPVDSDDHVFNVNCIASNAEYEQVEAHVRDVLARALTDADRESLERVQAMNEENIAYIRFVRMLARNPL